METILHWGMEAHTHTHTYTHTPTPPPHTRTRARARTHTHDPPKQETKKQQQKTNPDAGLFRNVVAVDAKLLMQTLTHAGSSTAIKADNHSATDTPNCG